MILSKLKKASEAALGPCVACNSSAIGQDDVENVVSPFLSNGDFHHQEEVAGGARLFIGFQHVFKAQDGQASGGRRGDTVLV
jgi:hypothetical protein